MGSNTRSFLVTGGAGYIGSHTVMALKERGYQVVVVDNFSRGSHRIAEELDVPIVEADTSNTEKLLAALSKYRFDAAMHFAAFAYVGESVTSPELYYDNNVNGTLRLLTALHRLGVNKIIFSSTCATYGIPTKIPIDETEKQRPVNPYGWSKLFVEQILRDFDSAYGMKNVCLRYFNASGAHESGRIGEIHDPETHLIPLAISAAVGGPPLKLFGTDYPTPDGTCIRDYIHVSDIADAHVAASEYLLRGGQSDAFNLGTGSGHSVREVICAVESVTGQKVRIEESPRRAGDPPQLVAAAAKADAVLSWRAKRTDLIEIVQSAWNWHQRTNSAHPLRSVR